jgi:hypothetical protein
MHREKCVSSSLKTRARRMALRRARPSPLWRNDENGKRKGKREMCK